MDMPRLPDWLDRLLGRPRRASDWLLLLAGICAFAVILGVLARSIGKH